MTVEVRDDISGRVIARRTLAYGHDYEIDYVQGVILLKQPLGSSATDGSLITDGAIAGNALYLVANYEFTPAAGEVKGYAYGARAHQWLGEKLRAGATAMSEETGSADQQLLGADVQLRHSEKTFLEAEIAGSRGPGFGTSTSIDGGISIFDQPSTGVSGETAMAYRIKAQADFGELSAGEFKGRIEGFYENLADNFSTLERHIDGAEQNYTVTSVIEVVDGVEIRGSYDEHREEDGLTVREASAQAAVRLDDHWSVEPGVKHSRRDGSTAAVNSDGDGERTDAGVRATYHWDEKRLAYVRVQGTVDRTGTRDRNDRAGLGGSTPLSEKVSLSGEVSYGTSGFGALAALDYAPTADDHYYLGYTLDPDRNDAADFPLQPTSEALGNAVAGARHRFSERLTAYGENRADVFGERQTLTQAYGVTYTPDARWTIGGGIESGRVFGDSLTGVSSDLDRTAVSASTGYRIDETVSARLKGEFRSDDSRDGAHDTTAYLLSVGTTVSLSDDWRLSASGDGVLTDATETTRDGDYAEASLGFAYRAAADDRLNALLKYTFLYDLPGADQVTVNGTTDGPQQRSHIFAADVSYDVIPKLTLGAKYGVRVGSKRNRDGSGGWQDAIANLGILRADFQVVHDWDVLVEGRALWTNPDETADFGVLAGVYRHINENLKLGAGYNFGHFSDDLRDQTFDDRGVFINLLGKL